MKQAPELSNLLVLISLALSFPVIQNNCHTGRTRLQEAITTDTLSKVNTGVKLIHADVDEISTITWTNRTTDIHVINKMEDEWYYAGMESLDKQKMDAYLAELVTASGDAVEYPQKPADEKIIIEGSGLMKPVIISVYRTEGNRYVIHSTHAPEFSFISDSAGLYKQLFSNLKALWP